MSSLKKESFKGMFWLSLGKIGTGVSSFVVTILLARLLTPEDFGLIELLMIFIAISNIFIDSGFGQAIIREQEPSQTDLSSIFWLNFGVAVFLYVFLFFIAIYIATFFNEPRLVELSRVTFLVIIFNSLVIVQNATLTSQLNFKAISQANVIGMFGAGILTLILAFLNMGVWAITANIVLQPLFKSIALWYYSTWRPSLIVNVNSINKYFSFGGFLLLEGLMDSIVTNISSLFIGKLYNKAELGYYSQGKKLNGYIISPFFSVVQQVTYPMIAKIGNEKERNREANRAMIQLLSFVFMPLSLFMCIQGVFVTVVLFGEKWSASGIFLSISAISGIFYPIQILSENIIKVKGKSKSMFYISGIKQAIRICAILSLVNINIISLACGVTLSGIVGGLLYTIFAFKLIEYKWITFFMDQWKTLFASILSSCIIIVVSSFLCKYSLLNMIYLIVIQCVSYLVISMCLKNRSLKLISSFIVNKYTNKKFLSRYERK